MDFILDPIYKILSSVVSYDYEQLSPILAELDIYPKKEDYRLDSNAFLKLICQEYFGNASPLVDQLIHVIPNPKQNNEKKITQYYSGVEDEEVQNELVKGDPEGPLMINIVKLFNH